MILSPMILSKTARAKVREWFIKNVEGFLR